jgi:hypothetical protein
MSGDGVFKSGAGGGSPLSTPSGSGSSGTTVVTQPGISTIGLPILTTTGTSMGTACGGSSIHIRVSGTFKSLTFAIYKLILRIPPIPTLGIEGFLILI